MELREEESIEKNHSSKLSPFTPRRKATLSTPTVFWDDVIQFQGEWYEGCRFQSISSDGPHPDFLFLVEFQDAGTRETKTRVSIHLSPDEEVWDHINGHQYWRIDPRPIFLESVREVLWNLKLVVASYREPTEVRTGVKFRQGGTILMLLRAEVCVDTGGNTVFHLANWTNQHIPDQLQAVFKEHPDARPPQTHTDAVIVDFKAKITDREVELSKTRERRLAERCKNPVNLSAFIDESGDIGLRTLAFSYTLVATVFPDAELESTRRDVIQLMTEAWRKQTKPDEIHFSRLSEKKRRTISAGLASILQAHAGKVLILDCRKDAFLNYLLRCEAEHRRTEEYPIITHWPDALADPDGQTKSTFLLLGVEEILCHLATEILDSGGTLSVTHDKKHKEWMNAALEEGFTRAKRSLALISESMYGKDVELPITLCFEHSEDEPCLWFADWIAWETGRWLRGTDASAEFDSCISQMTFIGFHENGKKMQADRLGGVATGEFDDVPREIHSLVLPTSQSN